MVCCVPRSAGEYGYDGLIESMYPLEVGSFYKYMDGGEYHDYSPDVSKAIGKFARTSSQADYDFIFSCRCKAG